MIDENNKFKRNLFFFLSVIAYGNMQKQPDTQDFIAIYTSFKKPKRNDNNQLKMILFFCY